MAALLDPANIPALESVVLLLGLSATRFAVAMAMMPLFAPETIPPLVRNSMVLSLAIIVLALQPPVVIADYGVADWTKLYAKEAFIGATIGFMFSSLLWALGAAGQIIDTKVGTTIATIIDPLSGYEAALAGAFLSRLANFVFMFSGGFLFFVNVLLRSFVFWPVAEPWPHFKRMGSMVFEAEFGHLMETCLLFAAPVLVVLYAIDIGFGLLNRYAQQLNVFSLSLAIKAWVSIGFLFLMIGSIVESVSMDIAQNNTRVLVALKRLL